jgi:hypothetical protein
MGSERITWEICPNCGHTAVVGWRDGSLIEFDCAEGCTPAEEDLGRLGQPAGGSSSLARWANAAWRRR